MSRRVSFEPSKSLPKLFLAGAIAIITAACGSDTMRFAENPFSNPFSSGTRDPATTGSIGTRQQSPQPAQLPPPVYPGSQAIGTAPLAPVATPPSAQSAPRAVAGTSAGWTAQGGTGILVQQGDSLAGISGRYGVPAAAILSANGLTNANQVTPGRQLIIPVYNAAGTSAPARQVAAPVRPAPASSTLNAQASAVAARPTQRQPEAKPAPQQRVAAVKPAEVKPAPRPVEQPKPVAAAPAPAPEPAPEPKQAAPETTASLTRDTTDFRWPARGRVIAGFNGKSNEGINIALPEGTPVKAAEAGTVAYAGSELKGYGNLVLIRHDNGFVSAYAHNSEIAVKRGEKVRRGQTIAKSGQTGNVSSPQLHFELRKGSTPVDPLQHLGGN